MDLSDLDPAPRPAPPSQGAPASLERLGFVALVGLTLAPVVFQGAWRPLAQALGVEADTVGLTAGALGVTAVALGAQVVAARRGLRRGLPAEAGAVAGLCLAVGLGRSSAAIVVVAAIYAAMAALCAAILPPLLARLPRSLDGLGARRKGAAFALFVLGILSVTSTARLAAFMGDADRPDLSVAPDVPFLVHHSCLTAYVEGSRLATEGVDNLYLTTRWPDLNGTPRDVSWREGSYAPFTLDAFAYPPPFLLLPRLILSWLPDFASQRALWFSLNGVLIACGLGTVAGWIGGVAGLRAALVAAVVWISPPVMITLQVGNAHAAVMVAAMLALVAFENRRPAVGGALLAFAIASKLSPGLLIFVLLGRRRYREVLWTATFGVALVAFGMLVFGVAPFVDFVSYELPRLGSGEALTFLAGPDTVPINLSPFGVPFKLASLGIDLGDPWAVARTVNRVYTLALLVLTVVALRKGHGPRATAEIWLALLTLSALQSPLAPAYALFPLFWLLSVRSIDVRGTARTVGFVLIWAVLAIVPPLATGQLLAYTLLQQAVGPTVAVYCLLRPSGREDVPSAERAGGLPAVGASRPSMS